LTETPPKWPTIQHDTLAGAPPPPLTDPLPPAGPPPPDRRIGAGMLLALAAILLVAVGLVVAWLLTHRANDSKATTVTTVLVTTGPAGTSSAPATAPPTPSTPSTTVSTQATTTAAAPPPPPPPQPKSSTMPDVQGQTEAAAVQSLWAKGILASLVFVPGSDTLGTVVSQAKPSGTTLPFHSHVQINLSRGPHDNPPQNVPNVIGKTLADAVSSIQAAHLRLIYLRYPVASQPQAGKIVQQSPLGGNTAPGNAQVLVYLGVFRG
jgi:hypothetical protein